MPCSKTGAFLNWLTIRCEPQARDSVCPYRLFVCLNHAIKMDHKKVAYIACLILPIAGVCVDIYTPALPAMVQYFSAAPQQGQLTITAYLLSYGVAQLLFGPLSDGWGRKRIMLAGTGLFLPLTFGMLAAPSLPAFTGLRILQGVAIAAIAAPCRALLPDTLHGAALKKAANSLALAFAIGPMIAPAVGGYLTQYFGWRAPITALGLYGCVVLALLFALPETHPMEKRTRIQSAYALFSSYRTILSSALFCIFVLIITLLYAVPVMFCAVVGPFLVQVRLQQSAVVYGHLGLLLGGAWLVGNTINRAIWRWSIHLKMVALLSALSLLSGLAALWFYAMPLSLSHLMAVLALIILMCGILYPAGFSFCLGLFPNASGSVSALMGATFITGVSLMSAVASALDASVAWPLLCVYFILFIGCLIGGIGAYLGGGKPRRVGT